MPIPDVAYVITGPTSGLGRATALAMTNAGTLVLVGRNREKLLALEKQISERGGKSISVVCDFANLRSVERASQEIIALRLNLAGLMNNAGVQNPTPAKKSDGLDVTFLTNQLGPLALTDALLPHLRSGARILFVGSATEDPERAPAKRAGFRGGRYISGEASLHGEWEPGGSVRPGMDAYATSKQCNIATALALAKENPSFVIDAIEPGIMFATGLHAHMSALRKAVFSILIPVLSPFIKFLSTPGKAAQIMKAILTNQHGPTGIYYDESGQPMQGSARIRDTGFQERVLRESRALISAAR